jgi:hypothetical protein
MDRSRSDRILDEWDAVTRSARQPAEPPRRRGAFGGRAWWILAPLAAALIVAVAAATWMNRPATDVAASPSPSATASAPIAVVPSETPPSESPRASASDAGCDPAALDAAIVSWEGAAGSRVATVTLRSTAPTSCTITDRWRPELVDGSGSLRIEGAPVQDAGTLTLSNGESLETLVEVANDCGPDPVAPVTIAFVLDTGDRVVATPLSPDDTTTAPCNGDTVPPSIQMRPWSR